MSLENPLLADWDLHFMIVNKSHALGPYQLGNTSSRMITEVKQR